MSYSEENGQVVLKMSKEDFDKLLMTFAAATVGMRRMGADVDGLLLLLNRLNSGNPHYTPYQVEEKKS